MISAAVASAISKLDGNDNRSDGKEKKNTAQSSSNNADDKV